MDKKTHKVSGADLCGRPGREARAMAPDAIERAQKIMAQAESLRLAVGHLDPAVNSMDLVQKNRRLICRAFEAEGGEDAGAAKAARAAIKAAGLMEPSARDAIVVAAMELRSIGALRAMNKAFGALPNKVNVSAGSVWTTAQLAVLIDARRSECVGPGKPKEIEADNAILGEDALLLLIGELGVDLWAADPEGRNGLSQASFMGRARAARWLLDRCSGPAEAAAAIAAAGRHAPCALMAAQKGHEECLHVLLDAGASANEADESGATALMLAAREGHEDCARALLDRGADIDARDSEASTALIEAASHREPGVVKLLLAYGADVAARNKSGDFALSISIDRRDLGAVEALAAATPASLRNSAGQTALELAIEQRQWTAVEALAAQTDSATAFRAVMELAKATMPKMAMLAEKEMLLQEAQARAAENGQSKTETAAASLKGPKRQRV
jgi:hypothetical protein